MARSDILSGDYDSIAKYTLFEIAGDDDAEELVKSEEVLSIIKGSIFRKLDKKEEARDSFEKVIEISPNLDSEAFTKLAKYSSDNYAVRCLNRKDAFFYILGQFEDFAGDKESALIYYKKALEINPVDNENNKRIRRRIKQLEN